MKPEKRKVYCEACKYFKESFFGWKFERCNHQNAFEGSYKSPNEFQRPPYRKNRNNDCPDFASK